MLSLLQLHSVDPHQAKIEKTRGGGPTVEGELLIVSCSCEGTGFMSNLWLSLVITVVRVSQSELLKRRVKQVLSHNVRGGQYCLFSSVFFSRHFLVFIYIEFKCILSKPDAEILRHALMTSRVGYCHAHFSGLPKVLQLVQNTAARFHTCSKKLYHITQILHTRADLKILLLT